MPIKPSILLKVRAKTLSLFSRKTNGDIYGSNSTARYRSRNLISSLPKPHQGICKDICIGGVLFENKEPLTIGSPIQIHTTVSDGRELVIIGKVIRVEAFNSSYYDIGVEISFTEMEKIAREEIAGLIKATQ